MEKSPNKKHIRQVVNFCITLVTLNRKQRVSIFNKLDKHQFVLIKELCVNLLINKELSLSPKEKAYFNNNLAKLKILGSKTVSKKSQEGILVKNQQLLKRVAYVLLRY